MKFVYGAAVLVGLLVIAAFLAPYVINWDWLKPTIASRAEESLGRKLAIDGAIEVRFLPTPRISVSDARLANLPGGSAADMARAKRLDLELALGALIGGRIEVVSVVLVDPVIELERLASGVANWRFVPKPKSAPATSSAASRQVDEGEVLGTTGIQTLELVNGALTYRDAASGQVEHLHGLEASVAARAAGGPYQVRGRMMLREAPLGFEGNLGREPASGPTPLSFALRLGDDGASATFNGALERPDNRLAGKLDVKGQSLAAMLDRFGIALPVARAASDEPFALTGSLSGAVDRVDLKELSLKLGDTTATGALSYADGTPAQLDLLLTLNKLDLDRLMGASDTAPTTPEDDGSASVGTGSGAAGPRSRASGADDRLPIPADLTASINLTIEAVRYRDAVIRAVQSILSLEKGAITVQQASAELPGGGDASLTGRISAPKHVPTFDGTVNLRADDLRVLANWLGIELTGVPADRLRRFSMKATVRADERSVMVPRLDAKVDSSTLTGELSIDSGKKPKPGAKPQITANLSLDRLTLDSYMPRTRPGAATGAARAESASAASPERAAAEGAKASERPEWLDRFDVAGTLHVAKLDYRDVMLTDVDINPLWRDGVLTIGELRVADLAGMALEASGTARAIDSPSPAFDAKLTGNAASLGALGRALGLEPAIRLASLGRASATATLKGGLDTVALNGSLVSEAGELAIVGEIEGLSGEGPHVALDLTLANATEETIRALLGARPAGPTETPTPIAFAGRLTGDQRALVFAARSLSFGPTEVAGDIRLKLDGLRPHVSAALKSEHFVTPGAALDSLEAIAPAAGRPEPIEERLGQRAERANAKRADAKRADAKRAAPARWSREPFDLAVLASFDGDLKLEATRLSLGEWLAESATVVATLKDGVLDVSRIEGRLFDGTLSGQAKLVAGARPVYAVDFTLTDADIDQVLRAVGEADAATGRVTLEGQLDSEGASEYAIVNALEGPIEVHGRDGSLEGIDLAAIRGALDSLDSLTDLAGLAELNLSRGSTPILTLDGTIQFNAGIARADDLRAVSDSGTCVIAGSANLPRWHLDGTAVCDLGVKDAAPVGVRLVGPIDRPTRQYQIDEFVAVVGKRLAARALEDGGLKLKLRKGAKSDAGTVADQVLRNVFGDPDSPDRDPPLGDDRPRRSPEPDMPASEPAPEASRAPELLDLLKRVVPDLVTPQ